MASELEIKNLRTVANYGKMFTPTLTAAAIYKREKGGHLNFVEIDGVKFVDIKKYPAR